jgi:hypothetical protein
MTDGADPGTNFHCRRTLNPLLLEDVDELAGLRVRPFLAVRLQLPVGLAIVEDVVSGRATARARRSHRVTITRRRRRGARASRCIAEDILGFSAPGVAFQIQVAFRPAK